MLSMSGIEMKIVLRVSFVVYICEDTVIPAAAHHNVCLPRTCHVTLDNCQLQSQEILEQWCYNFL